MRMVIKWTEIVGEAIQNSEVEIVFEPGETGATIEQRRGDSVILISADLSRGPELLHSKVAGEA